MISNELKATIQGAYTRFLEAKSLKPRYGQRLMIAEVAKVLGDIACDDEGRRAGEPAVVAVEAGTGACLHCHHGRLASTAAFFVTGDVAEHLGHFGDHQALAVAGL